VRYFEDLHEGDEYRLATVVDHDEMIAFARRFDRSLFMRTSGRRPTNATSGRRPS
jgi:hypothetical protein